MHEHDRYYRSPMQHKSITFISTVYHDSMMNTGRPTRSKRTDFAERLCRLREATGLSQREVARRLGIAQSSYANWERFNVALKPEQLLSLAKVLGVDVADLLKDTGTKRRGGPTGKMRQLFEVASHLPRSQQQKIVDILQPFVVQHAQNG